MWYVVLVDFSAELLDVLPEKRKLEDGGYSSDEGSEVLICSLMKEFIITASMYFESWQRVLILSLLYVSLPHPIPRQS